METSKQHFFLLLTQLKLSKPPVCLRTLNVSPCTPPRRPEGIGVEGSWGLIITSESDGSIKQRQILTLGSLGCGVNDKYSRTPRGPLGGEVFRQVMGPPTNARVSPLKRCPVIAQVLTYTRQMTGCCMAGCGVTGPISFKLCVLRLPHLMVGYHSACTILSMYIL